MWPLGHPARRDGAIAVAFFLLPGVIAVALEDRDHHLDGNTVAILISVSLGMPVLWLTWATYWQSQRSADGGLSLAEVSDQLAIAVRARWAAEAARRRLNDPWPLPVSWEAADSALTDRWDVLLRLAASGAGWREHPPPGTWAISANGMAGQGGDLANVLSRIPTGRLAVLGEPGAGKTMLMVRLTLDLLKDRADGGPVPVLVSLASWNPAEQDLHGWLRAQLIIDHPALSARTSLGGATLAQALLDARMILPILDGLDEIPDAVRGSAISRLNGALRPSEGLVLTCRTEQYRDAVRPPGGVEVTLRAAAAIQLCVLNPHDVSSYLREDAGGPCMAARWDPVLAVLETGSPVGQALTTPLMVGLACSIYNPRPGEQVGKLRDPAELRSPALVDRLAVERLLLDGFIPAAYRQHGPVGRWTTSRAESWLVFLACHLQDTIGGPDLAWWQFQRARSWACRLMNCIIVGISFALGWDLAWGLISGFTWRLGLGVRVSIIWLTGFGIATGIRAAINGPLIPSRGVSARRVDRWICLSIGTIYALPFGSLMINDYGIARGLATEVLVGLTCGLSMMLAAGVRAIPVDLVTSHAPC